MIQDHKLNSSPLAIMIQNEINGRPERAIPFQLYMELCLYHPEYGYYTQAKAKLGKEGDFYTSSAIGTIMAETICSAYMEWAASVEASEALTMVEWGGGAGRLASQILSDLRIQHPALYARTKLIMIEASPYHRTLQKQALSDHDQIIWMDEEQWLTNAPWHRVFVWANELLDAFPVHRLMMSKEGLQEIWVAWDQAQEQFQEIHRNASAECVDYISETGAQLQEGQVIECNLHAQRWMARIGEAMHSGSLTIIDYGDVNEELYASHRMNGTLMCYRQHQAHDNPYIYVGEQDITSHVDFTACEHIARRFFDEVQVESQMKYLVRYGILDKLRDHFDPDPFSAAAKRNRSIRQLLLSDQMSELFKVLTAHKN